MQVYCIISDDRVYRSKSPAIFSKVLKRSGINGAYVPFRVDPENIGQAMQSLRVLNIAGANVTVPYKEAVIPYLDVLSEGASIIGAINTIVCKGDELKGYNTNAIGIMDALNQSGFDAEGKSALVFGTGGAAKAAVFILNWLRTRSIFVTGRNEEKVLGIVKHFGGEGVPLSDLPRDTYPVELIVNATSVSDPEESPELAEQVKRLSIPECQLVFDLNYGRIQNFWADLAASCNARFMDGRHALSYQARRTFQLWTGTQLPLDEFVNALNNNK